VRLVFSTAGAGRDLPRVAIGVIGEARAVTIPSGSSAAAVDTVADELRDASLHVSAR
jgi:hypothetical protein